MTDVLDTFLSFSMTVQHAVQSALSPSAATAGQNWRALVEQERAALAAMPRNADDIPHTIIPAALPENPDEFVDPGEPSGEWGGEMDDATLRLVQDQAYEEGLQRDRQREEEREAQEEEEAMREAMEVSRREEDERQIRQLQQLIPAEPAEGGENVCSLALRLPDGSRLQRRLLRDDTVGLLRCWVRAQRAAHPGVPKNFAIVMDYPRRRFDDDSQTLQSAGMWPRAAINVVEDDEQRDF